MTTADRFKNPQAEALEAELPLGLASESAIAGMTDEQPPAGDNSADASMGTFAGTFAGTCASTPTSNSSSSAWVPVRRLGLRHHHLVLQHLLALDATDRQRRFGHSASDAMLQRYATGLAYESDAIFGVFNRRLRLVALAHLALMSANKESSISGSQAALGEFGVSVLPSARKRGLGARLFEHCIVHARNLGTRQLVIHLAANNTAMLRIVQKVGAQLVHRGNEVEARLDLSEASWSSRIEALVEEQAAQADFRIKLQLQRLDQMCTNSRANLQTKLPVHTRTGDADPGGRR